MTTTEENKTEMCPIGPGRVETLTSEEELKLKELWAYILKFWNKPAKIPVDENGKKHLVASACLGNLYDVTGKSINGGIKVEPDDASNTSIDVPSKKSRFSFGFGSSSHNSSSSSLKKKNSENGDTKIKKVNSLSESIKYIPTKLEIENKYTDEMVHSAVSEFPAEQMEEKFWKFTKFDSPDNLILRFVRARKWNVDRSLAMLCSTLHWRLKEFPIDDYIKGGELEFYEQMQASETEPKAYAGLLKNFELNKAYIKGHDKSGRPIVVVRPRLHFSTDQTLEEVKIFTCLIIEDCRMFLKGNADTASILFDMTGFSLLNMDYQPVRFIVDAFQAHYPECLGVLVIHKAPWVFSGIWNIIKNWLDPVVAAKVKFTKTPQELENYFDKDQLPDFMGTYGQSEPEYIYPVAGENDLIINGDTIGEKKQLLDERIKLEKTFVELTQQWIECQDPDISSDLLKQRINRGSQLKDNYRKLDKYVRGRSVYDRLGLIDLS